MEKTVLEVKCVAGQAIDMAAFEANAEEYGFRSDGETGMYRHKETECRCQIQPTEIRLEHSLLSNSLASELPSILIRLGWAEVIVSGDQLAVEKFSRMPGALKVNMIESQRFTGEYEEAEEDNRQTGMARLPESSGSDASSASFKESARPVDAPAKREEAAKEETERPGAHYPQFSQYALSGEINIHEEERLRATLQSLRSYLSYLGYDLNDKAVATSASIEINSGRLASFKFAFEVRD